MNRPTLAKALRHEATPLLAFAALYLVLTSVIATRKPLWNDELYTYSISRVPSIGDLWRTLETGADQAPPLSYLLTRASFSAFGVGDVSIRLPQIAAFLVFCACLYVFVRRRTNQLYGLIAMLLPTVTGAYYYATEARAYALVLAFVALALVCWQFATEGTHRRAALVGLALSLCLAISSHYYAVLVLLPLGLGELVRTLGTRRADIPVWVAFGGALLPLVAFVQLIRGASSYSSAFWAVPSWRDPAGFFAFLFHASADGRVRERDVILLVIVVAAVALLALSPASRWLRDRRLLAAIVVVPVGGLVLAHVAGAVTLTGLELAVVGVSLLALAAYLALRFGSRRPLLPGPPLHEVVAVGAFLLLPLVSVVLAKTVTNAYTDRYALSAVIGLVVLPLALYRLEGARPVVGAAVVAALAIGFVVALVPRERTVARDAAEQQRTFRFLEQHAGGRLPILIDDSHDFLELSYAPPPSLAGRLLYVSDAARDGTQLGLVELSRIADLRVVDRSDLSTLRGPLLALVPQTDTDTRWSGLPALKAQGRTVTTRALHEGKALYELTAASG